MRHILTAVLLMLTLGREVQSQDQTDPPYAGTVWIDPDIITPSDPTAFVSVTDVGRGQRTMYDQRVKDWIVVNAYLFLARFDDGLTAEIQVNPEFGSASAAMAQASKYGRAVGQLPAVLRTNVETLWIHKGNASLGGGNNNILIHTDFSESYLEEGMVHEGAHTSLDPFWMGIVDADKWRAAQMADGNFISDYARDHPEREDIAESFLPYLAVRYRSDRISRSYERTILKTIPNRIAYFDRLLQAQPANAMHPITPLRLSLSFAHFANGSSVTSDVVLLNVSTMRVRPTLYFADREGNRIDAGSVVEITRDLEVHGDGGLRVRQALPPLGELTISTHGRGDFVTGSVRVISDGPIGGVLRFDAPTGVAGVGASEPLSDALFPARRQAGGINTGVALRNLEAEAMTVSCSLMRRGSVLEDTEIRLAAAGQTARFIHELFPGTNTSDFVGSVRCTAPDGGRFAGIALEMDPANGIFTTLPVVPVDRTGAGNRETTLEFAHFANGSSISSDVVLLNVSTMRVRPTLYFADREGNRIDAGSVVEIARDLEVRADGELRVRQALPPLGELTISTHGRGNFVTGSVRVISDGPIGGVLRFDAPTGVAGVGASEPVADALFPARRQAGGINTGVALRNLEAEAMTVSCSLMRRGSVLEDAEIRLAAAGQTARFIHELFPGTNTSDFVGSVRCTAPDGGRFAGIALEMDPANGIFTTLPVVPVKGGTRPDAPPMTPTVRLSASPTTIERGQNTTLTWSSTNATSASITPGIGTVPTSGSRRVSPTQTTTYRITVRNADGQTASDTARVTVTDPPSGEVENYRIGLSFSVSENSLTAGQAFKLLTTVRHRNQTDETLYPLLYFYRSEDAAIDWETDAFIYNDYGRSISRLNPSTTRTASLDWLAPPYAGTYYYGVCVYIWGSLLCSPGVPVTVEGSEGGSPDLIVTSIESTHSSVTPRGGFTLQWEIKNIGTGPATPTQFLRYLSTDATIDATDTQISGNRPGNSSALPRMPADRTHRSGIHTSAPAEAGTYYYGVCIVPPLGETNIDNNCSSGVRVTVVGGGSPDLVVAGPLIRDYRPDTGEFLMLTPVVNMGEGLPAATTKRWYRSNDATIDATDTQIRTTTVSWPLYAARDFGAEYPVTAPTTPGTYYYGACVDPVPGESDTNNNCSEGVPMNVGVPDLAVGLAHVSTSAPSAGQSFTLRARVRNQGPDQAGATTLRWYRSNDATIDATDESVGTDAVSSLTAFDGLVSGPGSRLAASGSSRKAIRVTAPSTPGTYYYGACADGVSGEANTDNNCSAGVSVRVVPSGADPFHIELVFLDDFPDEQEDLFRQAARRWETIITQGLPDVDFSANPFRLDEANLVDDTVDDLRIFVRDAPGVGVAGFARPNYVRSGNPTGLPAVGGVSINSSFVDRFQEHNGLRQEEHILRNLMVHEIAHVLGMGPLWSALGLLHDRSGDAYFSGERAIQAFNAAGGENYGGNKVPVELRGVSCGVPAHWRAEVFKGNERVFRAETMEPTIEWGHALSAITVQSIADLGYVVDVSRADPYRLPASVNTARPPTASAKPVSAFELRDLGPIYVGDEQGQIIRTIGE